MCGMDTPREAMHLVGTTQDNHLITINSGVDLTDRMIDWIEKQLDRLEKEELCGFVFKAKSPSCGMRAVKIYSEKGMPVSSGSGLFAREFMKRFPNMPVEDEGRLHDDMLRENFIERIFAFSRWRTFIYTKGTQGGLVDFHTDHKLLLMAHCPAHLRLLGHMIGTSKNENIRKITGPYFDLFMEALTSIATVKKNVNVLYHIIGYFKHYLSSDDKQELREIIEEYHRELVPLIVPVVLIQHYIRHFNNSYLKRQYYLHPHPLELKLRNHA